MRTSDNLRFSIVGSGRSYGARHQRAERADISGRAGVAGPGRGLLPRLRGGTGGDTAPRPGRYARSRAAARRGDSAGSARPPADRAGDRPWTYDPDLFLGVWRP